ncbi:MAG: cob(I)yrinic acid a,c-diamide adenosyltransferase [Candidatus Kapabacteria bacterium]|nr:cob(I)yrinic acid a,c-diamide adenosyltransferase [Candidatus Kapabacteria bacterium]
MKLKIYTKTGDLGKTGLFNATRTSKSSLRVDAYGTIDELVSVLGIVLAHRPNIEFKTIIDKICSTLFEIGTDLASPYNPPPTFKLTRFDGKATKLLENKIDNYSSQMPVLKNFIRPGGCLIAAHLNHGRTVCRRAERIVVHLSEEEEININIIEYLNRLSDFLFTAARYANFLENIQEENF